MTVRGARRTARWSGTRCASGGPKAASIRCRSIMPDLALAFVSNPAHLRRRDMPMTDATRAAVARCLPERCHTSGGCRMTAAVPDIAIVDPCCARGYTAATPAGRRAWRDRGDGAARVAVLSRGHGDPHYQRGRTERERTEAGVMRPLADVFVADPPRRCGHQCVEGRLQAAQDPAGRRGSFCGFTIIRVVTTARWRARWQTQAWRSSASRPATPRRCAAFLSDGPPVPIGHIHNPIAPGLRPDGTPHDPDRLLFASSPHKGLAQVFDRFRAARDGPPVPDAGRGRPRLSCLGHGAGARGRDLPRPFAPCGTDRPDAPGALPLLSADHFAETFGLVMAEAQAVGLPVLAHDTIGANAEVVSQPGQFLDAGDDGQISRDCGRGAATADRAGQSRLRPRHRLRALAAASGRARPPHKTWKGSPEC